MRSSGAKWGKQRGNKKSPQLNTKEQPQNNVACSVIQPPVPKAQGPYV